MLWPALLFWFLRHFREPIREMLSNMKLKSANIGGNEFIFERVQNLQAELQKTNVVVGGLTEGSDRPEVVEAGKKLLKPPGQWVADWAKQHGADNPWDLGPLNWERCLFDLGCGGKPNELVMENGKLKYR